MSDLWLDRRDHQPFACPVCRRAIPAAQVHHANRLWTIDCHACGVATITNQEPPRVRR